MAKRFFVDISEDCNGNLTGRMKADADGTFIFETLAYIIDELSVSTRVSQQEILHDLGVFLSTHHKEPIPSTSEVLQ